MQVSVVLCLLEIKMLAAEDTPLISSKTTCSISATSCWGLKSKAATLLYEKMCFQAHKKFDASIDLGEFFLIAMLRLMAPNVEHKLFDSEGTLFRSEGITLKTCKIKLAQQLLPLFVKPTGEIKLSL